MKRIVIPVLVLGVMGITAFVKGPFKEADQKVDANVEARFQPIVVLELFTSQGCSSCPAADQLLYRAKENSDGSVITLSYHVDYWNYIGWEDPFSATQYTKKQTLYNSKFKNRSNYTPQLVVNGQEHFVGSDKAKLEDKIAAYQKIPATNKLNLHNVNKDKSTVHFEYTVAGEIKNKNLRAVLVLDKYTTHVRRGENRNRTLVNSNIVIAEKINPLQETEGKMTIAIPTKFGQNQKLSLVLLVEDDTYDITAAVQGNI